MDKLTKDDQTFLHEIRQNALLEREEAYHKMNLELEKKTSSIIEKIEKYSASRKQSRRTVQDCLKAIPGILDMTVEGGGGDSNTNTSYGEQPDCELDQTDPTSDKDQSLNTSKTDSFELITLFKGGGDFDLKRTRSAMSTSSMPPSTAKKLPNGRSNSSISPSSMCLALAPGDSCTDLTASELRHQSRLQKATESVVNCLQSKLVNHEARLTELHLQHRQKIQENTMLESKVKALEDGRERLLRTTSSLQAALDKQSKMIETCKTSAGTKSQIVESMKKEIDVLKREQKQNNAQVQSLQTRLNRTTEENERLKAQNKSVTLHLREVQTESRSKCEELNQRIGSLEQERALLSTTVARQSHLLRNMSHQKVILERIIYRSSPNFQLIDLTNNMNENENSIQPLTTDELTQ